MATLLQITTGLMVCLTAVNVGMGCSLEDITSKLNNCLQISVGDLTDANLTDASVKSLLSTFCENLECNIKCYIDAIGNCYLEDQFFTWNPDLIKVTNRAFCNDQNNTLAALTNCLLWTDTSCLATFATDILATQTEYTNGNYATYKSQYCSALVAAQSCIGFTTTGSCTAALASTAEAFYQASFSYTTCGIAEHAYFSTYGYDVTCGGIQLHQNIYVIFVIISIGLFADLLLY